MERVLGSAALVGGSTWIGLRFFSPEWGPAGSSAYLSYELWNRIWAPALLLMAAGFVGLLRDLRRGGSPAVAIGPWILVVGLVVMAASSIAEFWVFTNVPYGGSGPSARDFSWMSFLFGTLLAVSGATIGGIALAATHNAPVWLSGALAVVLPATVLLGVVEMSWVGLPLGLSAVVTGLRAVVSGPARATGAQPA